MNVYAVHDSFEETFRTPSGAVTCAETVQLCLFSNTLCDTKILVWENDKHYSVDMQSKNYNYKGRAGYMYCGEIKLPESPGLVFYCFDLCLKNGSHIYYCGKNGKGLLQTDITISYQITVYKEFNLPNWYKNCIVYQIFPDRFARSHEVNSLLGAFSHVNMGRELFVHENWHDEVNYEAAMGKQYYTPNDFFCGDLKGIENNIDYLKSLCVGCIYLNPIFESVSNHRYDTSNYLKVDAILGGDAAYFSLAAECKKADIHIMLDGVFSHTGADSVYFDKYGRYGHGACSDINSRYKSWYNFMEYPSSYVSWWGFENLPEVDEDNADYREHIGEVLKKWSCSWRLDVADELTDSFIRYLRKKAKQIDSDAVIIGEVWEDASDKHSKGARRGYTNGDELDGVMNYPLRQWIIDFLRGQIDSYEFIQNIMAQTENYPKEFLRGCLNILGSHDTVRILTVLCDAPDRDELPKCEQKNIMFCGSRLTYGQKKVILGMIVQFAAVGVPCIYYGDEIGMQGMADPFCRRTFDFGKIKDNDILKAYRAVCNARFSHCAFKGDAKYMAYDGDVIVIQRCYDGAYAYCAVNRSEKQKNIALNVPMQSGIFRDALTDKVYCAYKNILEFSLLPYEGIMLCSL